MSRWAGANRMGRGGCVNELEKGGLLLHGMQCGLCRSGEYMSNLMDVWIHAVCTAREYSYHNPMQRKEPGRRLPGPAPMLAVTGHLALLPSTFS